MEIFPVFFYIEEFNFNLSKSSYLHMGEFKLDKNIVKLSLAYIKMLAILMLWTHLF